MCIVTCGVICVISCIITIFVRSLEQHNLSAVTRKAASPSYICTESMTCLPTFLCYAKATLALDLAGAIVPHTACAPQLMWKNIANTPTAAHCHHDKCLCVALASGEC